MSLTIDGSGATATSSGAVSSLSATISTTNTNDIVLAFVHLEKPSGGAVTVSGVSGGGLTWALRKQFAFGTDNDIEIWWAAASAALTSQSITATFTGAIDDASLQLIAVSGVASLVTPWDANGSLPATFAEVNVANPSVTISTTSAVTMVLGFRGNPTPSGATAWSGFTALYSTTGSAGALWSYTNSEYETFSSAQSGITVGWTVGAGNASGGFVFDVLVGLSPTSTGTANGQASVIGGVAVAIPGTANGQASAIGQVTTVGGAANGQASVTGATSITINVSGTANGQASVAGPSTPASADGAALGQASVTGETLIIITSSGEADGQASATGRVPYLAVLSQNMLMHPSDAVAKVSTRVLTQNITGHQADTEQWRWGRTIVQAITAHLAQVQQTTYSVTDAEVIRLASAFTRLLPVTLTQNLTAHQATIAALRLVITQALNLSPLHTEKTTYHVVNAQALMLAAAFTRAFPVTLTQNLTTHQATVLAIAVRLLQNFKLTPAHIPSAEYHLALAQAVLLSPALARFLSLSLSQNMTAHAGLTRTYLASPLLTQNVTVHAALANTLVIKLVSTIDIHPAHIPHMIYTGEGLADVISMTGLYVSPGGAVTTWAINTRTNAVTEYTDYNFNSFAPMGRKYLAANASGIYELDGDTDAGAAIIAEVQSGLGRLNGTKMSGLKGAYLAVRGGGRFYVKLISGDGREYIYEAVAQPGLMTTKINVGKGLRTSYIAFNLQNEGQDFDIDSLEFVPMLSDRRV